MESEFIDLLAKAREAGARIMAGSNSSRANSIAMTNLETAELWARQDRKEKEDRESRRS